MRAALSRDGTTIVIQAATWEISDKVTFESLRRRFEADPVMAWTHYGSQPRFSTDKAIRDNKIVLRNANRERFSPWDEGRGDWKPWFKPRHGTPYYVHFDLSKSRDSTGFAMSSWDPPRNMFVVDAMRSIKPPMGGDIDFAEMRQIVYDLSDLGFFIKQVSYDMAFSAETRQEFEKKGYRTEYCSSDRTMGPYDTLIQLILSGRLDYYSYHIFNNELMELECLNGRKYDHPKDGSKDVSDAVACSLFMCVNDETREEGLGTGQPDVAIDPVSLAGFSSDIRRKKRGK